MINTSTTVRVDGSAVRAAASADLIERGGQIINDVLAPLGWLSSHERRALELELHFHLQQDSLWQAVRVAQQQCAGWLPADTSPRNQARRLLVAAVLRAFHHSDFDETRRTCWRSIGALLKHAADKLERHPRMILGLRYHKGADIELAALSQLFDITEQSVISHHAEALDALADALET